MDETGFYPAGTGPAGFAPAPPPQERRRRKPPAALHFDGATRDFLKDEDGLYKSVHPVDQGVGLALLVELQRLPSAPAVGSTLPQIEHVAAASLQNDVQDRVDRALDRWLSAGDITQLALTATPGPFGRVRVVYEYTNNRAPDRSERRRLSFEVGNGG